ncbi:MAG: hypothetical protein ACLQBY_00020 [Solirubrobacteraceae bacterium]
MPDKTPEEEAQEKRNREMNALLRALAQGKPADEETPAEFQYIDQKWRIAELKILQAHADQDIALREKYATWLLRILAAELVVVNVIFVVYAWAGRGWNLPEGVIQIWLGATFVQIVGVVAVVTRYLFPRRDQSPDLAAALPATTRTRGK